MKSKLSYYQLLVIIIVIIFPAIYAKSTKELLELSMEELLDLKITGASRSQQSIKKIPASVHIISREDILNNEYASLVDALEDMPGIRSIQPSHSNLGESYIMRGLWGNTYAKILINDIPIRPSVTHGMPIGEQIPMRNIDRIEVVYGPAAALYGADALAGIINIKTIRPESNSTLVEGCLGIPHLKPKNPQYKSGRFFTAQVRGDFGLTLYGGYSARSDQNVAKDTSAFSEIDFTGNPITIGKLPANNHHLGLEAYFKNFQLQLEQMYRIDHSSLEQDSRLYLWNDPELKYGETIRRAALLHTGEINKFHISTSLSYLQFRLDEQSAFGMVFYDSPLYKYMASDDILVDETVVYKLNDRLEFVGGLSFQYSGAMPKTNDLTRPFDASFYRPFSDEKPRQGIYQNRQLGDFGFNPLTYYNFGSFLSGTYTNDRFTLTGGLRYDAHSEYESKVNPRIAGLWNITPKLSIRSSYNQAFLAPSPYKVYNQFAEDNGDGTFTYWQLKNEELEPEELQTGELGGRIALNDNISIELNGFRTKISALVTSGRTAVDPVEYPHAANDSANMDVNSSDAESLLNGLDLIVRCDFNFKVQKLGFRSYTSFANGHETLPNGDEINIFRNVPTLIQKLKINATLFNSWFIGIDNTFCSKWYGRIYEKVHLDDPTRQGGPFFTMDLVTNYIWRTQYTDIRPFIRIDNILNEKYGGLRNKDNPQYMRTFFGGLQLML